VPSSFRRSAQPRWTRCEEQTRPLRSVGELEESARLALLQGPQLSFPLFASTASNASFLPLASLFRLISALLLNPTLWKYPFDIQYVLPGGAFSLIAAGQLSRFQCKRSHGMLSFLLLHSHHRLTLFPNCSQSGKSSHPVRDPHISLVSSDIFAIIGTLRCMEWERTSRQSSKAVLPIRSGQISRIKTIGGFGSSCSPTLLLRSQLTQSSTTNRGPQYRALKPQNNSVMSLPAGGKVDIEIACKYVDKFRFR